MYHIEVTVMSITKQTAEIQALLHLMKRGSRRRDVRRRKDVKR